MALSGCLPAHTLLGWLPLGAELTSWNLVILKVQGERDDVPSSHHHQPLLEYPALELIRGKGRQAGSSSIEKHLENRAA